MLGIYYDGLVSMKPEMEKKDFLAAPYDYGFSYQVPKVCFECSGEVFDPTNPFTWSDDSIVVVKDRSILKYTESKFHNVLVEDADSQKHWLQNREADICGFMEQDVHDSIETKLYMVEEYDLEKFEKRKYQVVLKETSKINHIDEYYIERIINKAQELDDANRLLTDESYEV